MEEKRINWTQIIVTAVLTGLVTIITGMILFNLQTNKPKLTFDAPETSPFQGTGKNFAIYNVTISNTGGTNIGNVVGVIQIPDSSLDEIKVTAAPSLNYKTNITSGTLTVDIPDLNPTESLTVSILATSQSEMNKSPDVSVRGTGIIGEKKTSSDNAPLKTEPFSFFVLIVATLVSGISAFSSVIGRRVSSITIAGLTIPIPGGGGNVISGKHSDDQNKVFAYLCGLHGLVEDVDKYLLRQGDTAYWSEADRFGTLAILSPNSDEAEKRKKVLIDLLKYANMAGLSEAIVQYNIARIAFAQNNIEEAKKHLLTAKKNGGKLIETRLEMESKMKKILEQKSG